MRELLVGRLEAIAARRLDNPALKWRGSPWTYAALDAAVKAVSSALIRRRFPPQARIALLLRNCPQYVACFYATLRAGYAVVPLNVHERASVLMRQVTHSGASMIVCDLDHPERSAIQDEALAKGVEFMGVSIETGSGAAHALAESFGALGETGAPAPVRENDLAAIIYTSGTTGAPKGVMLSHKNLAANAGAIIQYLELTEQDRGLCVLPFHFSYGNSVLHTHLLCGAELFIEENFAFPHLTLQRIQNERVTGFSGVPSTFAMLLARCRFEEFDLGSLRYITQAGGAMAKPLIMQLRRSLPQVKIFIMYGQTEATARLTFLPPELLEVKLGSVGKPIPGVEIEVRSADNQPAKANEIGEIYARGDNVMLGYWRNPDATFTAIRDGWLRTGDLGRWDEDGYLYIEGRTSEMIKVGAYRVSPQEVEEAISSLEGVEQVGVTAIADELLGQAIKALVVPSAGANLNEMTVKAHCRKLLAMYKIPKIVEFVADLPRTSSGKLQRFKLAEENKR